MLYKVRASSVILLPVPESDYQLDVLKFQKSLWFVVGYTMCSCFRLNRTNKQGRAKWAPDRIIILNKRTMCFHWLHLQPLDQVVNILLI